MRKNPTTTINAKSIANLNNFFHIRFLFLFDNTKEAHLKMNTN